MLKNINILKDREKKKMKRKRKLSPVHHYPLSADMVCASHVKKWEGEGSWGAYLVVHRLSSIVRCSSPFSIVCHPSFIPLFIHLLSVAHDLSFFNRCLLIFICCLLFFICCPLFFTVVHCSSSVVCHPSFVVICLLSVTRYSSSVVSCYIDTDEDSSPI